MGGGRAYGPAGASFPAPSPVSVARFFLTLGLVVVLVVALAAAAGVLAYGTEPTRQGTLEIAGLASPATVAWDDSGRVWVEGPDEVALAAGLGYAHAADQGWQASLWRQAAGGRLAEWFGDQARGLDLHARALGFDALARRTYERMGPGDRAVLDAYALGASAGFAEPGVAQGTAFIVADVVPGPWQPSDALAVERLHAYLAAPALTADTTWRAAAAADSSVAAFVRADSLFRAFLGFPGGGHDRVYALDPGVDPDRAARTLVQQASAGTSASAYLAPAVLRTPGRSAVALTIPGTLVSPSGWSGGLGWGLLMSSDLRLERYGGPAPDPVYSRIVERDGDETLLAVTRDADGLVLRAGTDGPAPSPATDTTAAPSTAASGPGPATTTPRPAASGGPAAGPRPAASGGLAVGGDPAAAGDSARATGWRLRWSGFRLGSDLGAFRALRAGRVPGAFALLDGDGLAVRTGGTRLLGSPAVASASGGVAFVAQDTLARWAATALRQPARDTLRADSTLRLLAAGDLDLTSGWARDRLPGLIAGLGARDSLPDVLQVPYAYLNGWDGAYRADGVAPSLFEWWMVSHRDVTGHLPDPADSLDVALLPSTLRIARAELRDRYGPLPDGWRWGRLQGGPRHPVLAERGGPAARRFRRPLPPPGGHPTAPLPGPSLVFPDAVAGLSVWSVAVRLADGRTEVVPPRLRPPPTGILDPEVGADGRSLVLSPSAPLPSARLALRPAP